MVATNVDPEPHDRPKATASLPATDLCTMYARVTIKGDGHGGASYAVTEPGGEFWHRVSNLAGRSLDSPERVLQTDLPRFLERRFVERLGGGGFGFSVKVIGYGSALLAIDVTGIQNLAKLLNDNFDLFVLLTEAFVSSGFEEIFSLPEGSVDVRSSGVEAVRSKFLGGGGNATPEPAPADAKADSRMKYVRMLIQSTLLAPVLLALLVCYVAMNAWYHERDLQKGEADRLSHERAALLDFAKNQLSSLAQQNTDLSKALAQSGASEVIAIVQRNTELMKESMQPGCCCSRCFGTLAAPPSKSPNKPTPLCK